MLPFLSWNLQYHSVDNHNYFMDLLQASICCRFFVLGSVVLKKLEKSSYCLYQATFCLIWWIEETVTIDFLPASTWIKGHSALLAVQRYLQWSLIFLFLELLPHPSKLPFLHRERFIKLGAFSSTVRWPFSLLLLVSQLTLLDHLYMQWPPRVSAATDPSTLLVFYLFKLLSLGVSQQRYYLRLPQISLSTWSFTSCGFWLHCDSLLIA